MRSTAITAVFGLLFLVTFTVGGEEKKPPVVATPAPTVTEAPADPTVQKLIDNLSSDDWRTREKAGNDLATLGEKALPQMRKALLTTTNAEIQRRLALLVRKMDRDRLVEPKRVTLNAKDQTPKELFDAIAKQTGYRIEYSGGGQEAKHSFEFKNTPFWQAVDAVANAAGCNLYPEYDDDAIRVYNQDSTSPHVAYSGPFRVLATSINSNRSVQLANINRRGDNPRPSEYMNLSFQIQSEPKNPMLGILLPELLEAKDDLGGSLLPPRDQNNYNSYYYNNSYRGHNTYMNLNLVRGDRAATSIKTLKGRVGIILLAGTMADVAISDPLKVKKKTFTGRTVELELQSLTENANQKGIYTATFSAKKLTPSDQNRNEDYTWSNTLWQRLELLDEKGNKYHCYGPSAHNNNGLGTVQMTVQFSVNDRRTGQPGPVKLGVPVKFVLNEWLTTTQEVKFEYKNIPLP